MRHRTLDEMISYFNQQVSTMDIDHSYKVQLLGMVAAIGYGARENQKGEPIADLIERQAAINALDEEPAVWDEKDEYEQGLNSQWHHDVNAIKAVPSAQQWIPCNEKEPALSETEVHSTNRRLRDWFLVTLESGTVQSLGYEYEQCRWHITGSPVIAWMPLPEPYLGR